MQSIQRKTEALMEMSQLVGRNGLMVVQAGRHVPVIATAIADKDGRVRNAALNLLAQLHDLLGETVLMKHLGGTVTAKEFEMFQERLKHRQDGQSVDYDVMPVESTHQNTPQKNAPVSINTTPVPRIFTLDPAIVGSSVSQRLNSLISATPSGHKFDLTRAMETPTLPASISFLLPRIEDPVDMIIHQIATEPDFDCIAALQRLDEYIADSVATLLPRVVPLVQALRRDFMNA